MSVHRLNGKGEAYVNGAIANILADLRQDRPGQYNQHLNEQAFALGSIIAGANEVGTSSISYDEAERQVLEAASASGYVKRDGLQHARTTIQSGLKAGRRQPRDLLAAIGPTQPRRSHSATRGERGAARPKPASGTPRPGPGADAVNAANARRIWDEAKEINPSDEASPAIAYIRSRLDETATRSASGSLQLDAFRSIRFHPACPEGDGAPHRRSRPAIVARLACALTGEPRDAVQRIFLKPDGSGKADDMANARRSLAPFGDNGVVVLGRIEAGCVVYEAEGVEKALAIKAALPHEAVIATLGAHRLGKCALPNGCRRVIVGDNKSDADRTVARAAARRRADEDGCRVGLAFPGDAFGDADAHCKAHGVEGSDGLRAALEQVEWIQPSADLLVFPGDGSSPHSSDGAYLIKRLIPGSSVGSLIGPSGMGKTTIALDLCFHIALGKSYHGKRVRQGPVLYVGYEGGSGLDDRIAAAVRALGDPGRAFARIVVAPSLNRIVDGENGVREIIAAAQQLVAVNGGTGVSLIVIDTKARATAGDNEDSAADTAFYVEHRAARLARDAGASILTVHHTGKDEARGGRGSSAFAAADDFRLLTRTSDGKQREVYVDKCRDGPDHYPLAAYDLEPIVLRHDAEGDAVTACTVVWKPAEENRRAAGQRRPKPQSQRALDTLVNLYTAGNALNVPIHELGLEGVSLHDHPKAVKIDDWRSACSKHRLSETGDKEAEKKAFQRANDDLETCGKIQRHGTYVWLLGQKRRGISDVPEATQIDRGHEGTFVPLRPREQTGSGTGDMRDIPL